VLNGPAPQLAFPPPGFLSLILFSLSVYDFSAVFLPSGKIFVVFFTFWSHLSSPPPLVLSAILRRIGVFKACDMPSSPPALFSTSFLVSLLNNRCFARSDTYVIHLIASCSPLCRFSFSLHLGKLAAVFPPVFSYVVPPFVEKFLHRSLPFPPFMVLPLGALGVLLSVQTGKVFYTTAGLVQALFLAPVSPFPPKPLPLIFILASLQSFFPSGFQQRLSLSPPIRSKFWFFCQSLNRWDLLS